MNRAAYLILSVLVSFLATSTAHTQEAILSKFLVKSIETSGVRSRIWTDIGFRRPPYDYSIAVVMGVSRISCENRGCALPEVDRDIENLVKYFRDDDLFDEIIVIKNEDFALESLSAIFQNHIPSVAAGNKRLRLVVTYSGHGVTDGGTGYFLQSKATSLDDLNNSISADVLRSLMQRSLQASFHSLVLIIHATRALFSKTVLWALPLR